MIVHHACPLRLAISWNALGVKQSKGVQMELIDKDKAGLNTDAL